MIKIKLKLKNRSYDILVGSKLLKNAGRLIRNLRLGSDAFIISNKKILSKYANALLESLRKNKIGAKTHCVLDSEKSKSLQTAFKVIKKLSAFDKRKKVFIIAFGGGVVGDLSGFVASVYKRGVPYVQIPTTLLAQVDSAIGGKTAVDLISGKNLVGAFYQPRLVISDVDLLKSLSLRQLRSGLSEIIKYALIKDSRLFAHLEKEGKNILKLNKKTLINMVVRCSEIKARIVSADEKEEKGIRTILNFGHTIGHAIEAAGDYKRYNHGEALAIGMVIASRISNLTGLIDVSAVKRIIQLLEDLGLPIALRKIPAAKIIQAHYYDKKFLGKKNRFVLLEKIGRANVVENIPLKIILDCLKGL